MRCVQRLCAVWCPMRCVVCFCAVWCTFALCVRCFDALCDVQESVADYVDRLHRDPLREARAGHEHYCRCAASMCHLVHARCGCCMPPSICPPCVSTVLLHYGCTVLPLPCLALGHSLCRRISTELPCIGRIVLRCSLSGLMALQA